MMIKKTYNGLCGFTIVEMMVVVVIMVILTVAAVPAFHSFTINSKAASIANRLANTLRMARSEALNKSTTVVICPIDPGQADPNTGVYPDEICRSTIGWNAWLVFADQNGDSSDTADEVIKYYEDIPPNTITSSSYSNVRYDSSGFCVSGGHTFTIRPAGCSGKSARVIEVKPSGNIKVELAECQP
jgi:type IV fimbrial biogenesis protein FimT